jgi:hypothetical protein
MVLPRHCHWRTGSGIWFNMGKMMAFHEHSDAVKKFPGGKTATCKTGDEAMSNAAANVRRLVTSRSNSSVTLTVARTTRAVRRWAGLGRTRLAASRLSR